MKELIKKLEYLATRWNEMATEQVPPEYACRNMHEKYFRMDNEAAGLANCAEELLELLSIEAAQLPLERNQHHTPCKKCEGAIHDGDGIKVTCGWCGRVW